MQKSVQQPMAWLVLLATGHRRRWTLHGLGSFQKVLYLVCAYQSISCGIHYLSSVLMSIIPEHACKPPGMVRKAVFHNVSAWRLEDILALRSPEHKGHIMVELQDGEIWELTRCSRMWRENTSHLGYEYSGYKRDSPCSDGYVYDQSKWRNSVVKSFNLVCDQKWYASIIQPLFIFGVLLGSITFSYLSDRFGRRLALWCTSIGVFFFGIASLFIFDYFSFMVVRFFLVTAASGYFVVVFVYVMEIIGKKSRTWASMQLNTFFAIGAMLVALASYLVSTWWLYQITLCILTSPFIMCCWMLPETPFWLLSEGRYKEAQGTVDAMAVWNQSRSCDLVELLSLDMTRSPDKSPKGVRKHRLADLFYNLDVAKMTLIVWLGWFTANLGYYLFTMEAIRRKENEPLYLLLVGAMEIPAYVFLCIWLKRVGRRKTMLTFLLVSSFICVAYVVMPLILFGILTILSGLLSLKLPETQNTPMTSTWETTEQQVPENKDSLGEAPPVISERQDSGKALSFAERWGLIKAPSGAGKKGSGRAPLEDKSWGSGRAPPEAGKRGLGGASLEDESGGSHRAPPKDERGSSGRVSLEDESWGSGRALPKAEKWGSGRDPPEAESGGSDRALLEAEK
ncbi:solute carrier family 22 member 16 isoform X4 [Mastomys coucha]|uniref:solute carrier family 22 member 16 isoform X4 n=1 Tax=Mastomys coucha TaxID=35658 RepID=UPI001262336F|nr:solute carrier family 22 member 16 isoform X4 [Mastomys coucha]